MIAKAIKFTNGYKWVLILAVNLIAIGIAWGKMTSDTRYLNQSLSRLEIKLDENKEVTNETAKALVGYREALIRLEQTVDENKKVTDETARSLAAYGAKMDIHLKDDR